MAEKIIVGCKLPNGLILHHPLDSNQTVNLNGLNKVKIIGADYATTEVDADFWQLWKAQYKDYQPLRNGSIFEARNPNEAIAKGKELSKVKTGFEGLSQDAPAPGLKKATDKD